jgi:hypothetical protein
MNAVIALTRVRAIGVRVTRNGKNLVLRASKPPSAELIDLLKQHKGEIIALLENQSVARDADKSSEGGSVLPDAPASQERERPTAISAPSVDTLQSGDHLSSTSPLTLGDHDSSNAHPSQTLTSFLADGTQGVEGGDGGAFLASATNEAEAALRAKESDPNPNLPWPLPGETLLPGWGTRVSMEYRLRNASEDACLDWAKEPWQLELVAKARGYSQQWVDQILLNRAMWKEAFAARHEGRAPNFNHPAPK